MARREQVMHLYVFLHAGVATRGGGKVIELWGKQPSDGWKDT